MKVQCKKCGCIWDDFDRLKDEVVTKHKYVAICRGRFKNKPTFYIVFKRKTHLRDFLRVTDDGKGTGFTDKYFYACGYVNGKFYDENT